MYIGKPSETKKRDYSEICDYYKYIKHWWLRNNRKWWVL